MQLSQYLALVQWFFLIAEFVAGGISIHFTNRAYKVFLGPSPETEAAWESMKAESDAYLAKHKLAERWMYALLACVLSLLPIIVIISFTTPKG